MPDDLTTPEGGPDPMLTPAPPEVLASAALDPAQMEAPPGRPRADPDGPAVAADNGLPTDGPSCPACESANTYREPEDTYRAVPAMRHGRAVEGGVHVVTFACRTCGAVWRPA